MRKASAYSQILATLNELHKDYPKYNMGRHLATALDEYGDIWGLTDREILFALKKYKAKLQMDIPHDDSEIERFINEGIDLDNILIDENGS